MVQELTDITFNTEVIQGKKAYIIDFWAAWCGPCKMLAPIFEEVEKDYKGKLHFAKLNIDQYESLAREYEIMSIPCLVVFAKGKEVERIVGLMPKAELKKQIDAALKKI
ncbi:MAG: thioredoxin [Candidatus Diapherotrites archaeon]|uniref:Thioredoxin n=1 Tax=Candidatus Iainarchaeum sp. TaxID=3101447 RepID=A0A8T4C7P9_9ARCH|nr:thioredoxin [Candidatus Diapherotrites archaeon]